MRKHVNVSNEVQSGLRLEDFLWTFCEHFEFWAQICSSFCFYLEIPGFRFRFERYISSLVVSAKARLTLYWPMCCRAPEDGLVCGWELPNRPVCSCGGHWRAKLHWLMMWSAVAQLHMQKFRTSLRGSLKLSANHMYASNCTRGDFVMRHGWRILGWYFWNSRPHRQIPCAELHWRSFQEGHIAEGNCLQILNIWVQIKESHRIKWKDW